LERKEKKEYKELERLGRCGGTEEGQKKRLASKKRKRLSRALGKGKRGETGPCRTSSVVKEGPEFAF